MRTHFVPDPTAAASHAIRLKAIWCVTVQSMSSYVVYLQHPFPRKWCVVSNRNGFGGGRGGAEET